MQYITDQKQNNLNSGLIPVNKFFLIWNDKATTEGVCVFDFVTKEDLEEFLELLEIKNPQEYADGWYVDGEVEFLIIEGRTKRIEKNEV